MDQKAIALAAAKALDAKRGKDIVVLKVDEMTVITDYMVIATGRSVPQVKALAENVEEAMRLMQEIDRIGERLPGLDCGSCGAPSCRALATDIAEWLVKNGVPFRHAHELSGACVKIAEDRGQELWDLTDEDFINVFKDFLPADKAPQVREVLSTEGSVSARNGKGGTSPLRVREQIVSAKTTIEQLRAFANSVSDGSAYKSPESLLK